MKRFGWNVLRRAGVFAAAAMVLAACASQPAPQAGSGAAGESAGAAEESVFVYGRSDSVTSLDLHREITSNNAFAIDKIFEPLVICDNEGNIQDYLAKSHTISDDGCVYTFVLRDGLQFSDGTPVTAKDVKFTIERHLEVGGALPIEAEIKSVEAADDKTAVITLESPFTPFLSELAGFAGGILPADFGGRTEEEFFQNPVGTGPFRVRSWDPSGDLVFEKNPCYWQEGKPYIDSLVFKVITDDNQKINQLKAGQIDAVEDLSLSGAKSLEGSGIQLITCKGWNVEEVFFNTLEEHLADVHVRRALAKAIDKEALTQALTFGYAAVDNSVLPESIRYYAGEELTGTGTDLEEARAEMAKSAFKDGFEISLMIPSGNNIRLQEAQIIQQAAEQIGIRVQIEQKEIAAFREAFLNLNYDIMINSAMADYPDADSIMAFQVDPEGFSKCYWTSYNNPEAVELMKKARTTPDGEERGALYLQLQQILFDDAPYIPLYNQDVIVGAGAGVEGLEVTPGGSVRFENVRK